MKIGIRIDDSTYNDLDLRNPDEGNPGIGGTQYEEALLAFHLLREKDYHVVLYHFNSSNIFPNSEDIVVNDTNAIIEHAVSCRIDIMIYACGLELDWYRKLENNKIVSVAWAHCYINHYELKLIRRCKYVKRVVFVGREEYSSYVADDIIEKSSYIYNMFPENKDSFSKTNISNTVVFLGAINKDKGFHVLAKAWKKIIKEVPDAKLEVIGSGKLYSDSVKMGAYNIARFDYEKTFINNIIDEDGKILESISFRGIMGADKKEVIKSAKVGVVNPTGLTETFCISAVEIESCGVPVCTTGKFGLLDTVVDNETGLFSYNTQQLSDNIIKLLKDDVLRQRLGENAREYVKKFTPDKIMKEWINLFDDVVNDIPPQYAPSERNSLLCDIKRKIHYLRFQKNYRWVPSLIRFEFGFQGMWRVFFRDIIRHYYKG